MAKTGLFEIIAGLGLGFLIISLKDAAATSTSTSTTSTTPNPFTTPSTGTTTSTTGTTGTTQSTASTSTTPFITTTPYPVNNGPTGIYVPAYGGQTQLNAVIAAKTAHPKIPFVVSFGGPPGTGFSQTTATNVRNLTNLGVVCIGYVPTGYTTQPPDTVKEWIRRWHDNYASYGMRGIMFDEMRGNADSYNYYVDVAGHARTLWAPQGGCFLRANPGAAVAAVHVPTFDSIAIYESGGYPTLATIQQRTFNGQYGKKFMATIHSTPAFNPTLTQQLAGYLSHMYVTDDLEPNPYDVMPTYWQQELSTFDQIDAAF